MDHIELHEKIWVFPQEYSRSLEALEYFKPLLDWEDWYGRGVHTSIPSNAKTFDTFPSKEEWQAHAIDNADNEYSRDIERLFHECTKEYVEANNISLPNWDYQRADIAQYYENTTPEQRLAMQYHTDFQLESADQPGPKFDITCLFYLDDDYDGGEISFLILDEYNEQNIRLSKVKEIITYKPKAGDIVIFPATAPFFHGVLSITRGVKSFIRTYWKHISEGSDEWNANAERYGMEAWMEMEDTRIKKGRAGGGWTLSNEDIEEMIRLHGRANV